MSPHVLVFSRFRRETGLAVLLVAIASARIISTYTIFNHTIDEPDHLAAGMEWLSIGKYRYEDQHPPLGRIFAALGPFLAGERWRSGPNSHLEGYRILGWGEHYDRTLAIGRAGILPFFWAASLVVYLWGYRICGDPAALLGTLVFTTLPPVLAHAGLMTTDMAAAACIAAAVLASLYWAEKPTSKRTVTFGFVLGLAMLSKFSSLVFLPAAWLLMYGWHVWQTRQGLRAAMQEITTRRKSIATVAAIACFVIWAGYLFSFGRVEFLHLRLPAERFFSGIHSVWMHERLGHPSYLLGRRSGDGFWYYYPVVLAIKTPLAILVLLFWSLWVWRADRRISVATPAAFTLGILLVSLASRINIGVRHVLPVYFGISVVCGYAAARVLSAEPRRRTLAKAAILALLAWSVISGAWQHPDYLAYTNEIAGNRPEQFLADSDLDWGQDMKRLGDVLAQNRATSLTFTPFNRTYASLAGHPLPPTQPGNSTAPSPGWNAVSITIWKVFAFPAWAARTPPQKRIGRSILLCHVPEKPSQ